MKVSIKQISQMTGFSPATVSNALNRKMGVDRETSERIFRAAEDLGYEDESFRERLKEVLEDTNI